jgi:methylated-DNA-[protein]-cysteine S-methyltransferase
LTKSVLVAARQRLQRDACENFDMFMKRNDDLPRALRVDRVVTPLGEALLVLDEAGRLRALDWVEKEARLAQEMSRVYAPVTLQPGPAPTSVRRALTEYFDGRLNALESIPWRAAGTAFQLAVWTALPAIRAGQTLSYGELARRLGNPRSVRAVGLANGANPIGIVVPCHRVIGSDGSLTGYGGGLHRKRWLLRHEAAASAADQGQLFG